MSIGSGPIKANEKKSNEGIILIEIYP